MTPSTQTKKGGKKKRDWNYSNQANENVTGEKKKWVSWGKKPKPLPPGQEKEKTVFQKSIFQEGGTRLQGRGIHRPQRAR